MSEWFRVNDQLSPLHGCDVRGSEAVDEDDESLGFLMIEALRRVDVFVGDRPHQLVAPEGGNLGLMIAIDQLEESPIQDDVVELVTDRPHGRCIEEYQLDRSDAVAMRVASFESAHQVAVDDNGELVFTTVITGLDRDAKLEELTNAFRNGAELDDLLALTSN